ncbi:hypothetical protein ACFY7C_01125 [Streptomyces sp. NPDC012769]|uniref:hypothetical protein n=1 Tax=Streptomyces sp. NPDC012769 TaxID=3364848 RepID=UPI0036A98068
MELTQATVDDLLARVAPEGGFLYVPGDLDPQDVTDLLGARYGAPRTLVLEGFVDPTVDESRGAALLGPLGDRVVTMRAWAYGDRWVGTGTARDAEAVEREVLAVARREVPEALTVAADEGDEHVGDVDWVERLGRITGWARPDRRRDVDWAEVETRIGTALPSDYKRMVEMFGKGAFDGYLGLMQEPATFLREEDLLVWAGTEHEDLYCWRTEGDDPDRWSVVVQSFDGEDVPFGLRTAEFVCRILTDPHQRFTMARYFDTHWFMTYGEPD